MLPTSFHPCDWVRRGLPFHRSRGLVDVRYLFCINPGRSGSDYLTGLLRHAHDCVSVHEGLPIMNGLPMQRFNEGDERALGDLMPLKWKAIERQRGRRHRVYSETNHSFIKGWGWLVPDAYADQQEIGVVVLRRDPSKVALSLLRLHDVPGTSTFSRTWYLSPTASRNVTKAPESDDPYELCRWYAEEIYRRADDYRRRFPKVRYYDCEVEQLNDLPGVQGLFKTFGLKPKPTLSGVVGQRFNTREVFPRWSKAQLLDLVPYVSPDAWPAKEKDQLIADMLDWIGRERADQWRGMRRNRQYLGTWVTAATELVVQSQRDLEEAFKVRLRYTETERCLIQEMVYRLDRRDFAFLFVDRNPPPGLSFTYDFNRTLDLATIYRHLGPAGVLRTVGIMMRGAWGGDKSHHGAS